MEYREKLLSMIFDEDDETFTQWLESHSPLDQVQILKELKELSEELLTEEQKPGIQTQLDALGTKSDEYQELYLDEQMAKLNLEMAIQDRDRLLGEMDKTVTGMRDYVKDCILTNAPNAKEMKLLAQKIIALEKENGNFDPANWEGIEF